MYNTTGLYDPNYGYNPYQPQYPPQNGVYQQSQYLGQYPPPPPYLYSQNISQAPPAQYIPPPPYQQVNQSPPPPPPLFTFPPTALPSTVPSKESEELESGSNTDSYSFSDSENEEEEKYEESHKNDEGVYTIIVDGIDENVTEKSISDLFGIFGSLKSCKIIIEDEKRYGLVEYSTEESASKAIEKFNGIILKGCKLTVEWYNKISMKKKNKIILENLPHNIEEEKIRYICSVIGEIESLEINRTENENGRSKCVIYFKDEESIETAKLILEDSVIDGLKVELDVDQILESNEPNKIKNNPKRTQSAPVLIESPIEISYTPVSPSFKHQPSNPGYLIEDNNKKIQKINSVASFGSIASQSDGNVNNRYSTPTPTPYINNWNDNISQSYSLYSSSSSSSLSSSPLQSPLSPSATLNNDYNIEEEKDEYLDDKKFNSEIENYFVQNTSSQQQQNSIYYDQQVNQPSTPLYTPPPVTLPLTLPPQVEYVKESEESDSVNEIENEIENENEKKDKEESFKNDEPIYTIKVDGIGDDFTEKYINDIFSIVGNLLSCKIITEGEKRYALIEYSTEDSAIKAINKFNGMKLKGCKITVNWYNRNNKIILYNLPPNIEEEKIRNICDIIGDIESLEIIRPEDENGRSKCFLTFKDEDSIKTAKLTLKDCVIDGLEIEVIVFKGDYIPPPVGSSPVIFLEKLLNDDVYIVRVNNILEDDEKELLEPFTVIENFKPYKIIEENGKRYALVEYSDGKSAAKAISLNGNKKNGNVLNVCCILKLVKSIKYLWMIFLLILMKRE